MGFKVCLLLAAIFSHTFVIPVTCGRALVDVHDQKNYYPPGSPHHSRHKRSSGKSDCRTPPSKSSSSSHGGSYGLPPSHGRSGSGSTSPKGGSYHGAPPSHGSRGSGSSSPSPKGGSLGGSPPSHGSKGSSVPAPTVPPLTPTPTISTPLTPPLPNPNIFTGTCDFWRTHPALIWALLGCWGSLANFFGFATTTFFGGNPTVLQALANTRNDGYGALLREGTAAYLNSLRGGRFPLTTQQVREQFNVALASDDAVEDQAKRFRLANEGHVK